jgi:hypothetical protein
MAELSPVAPSHQSRLPDCPLASIRAIMPLAVLSTHAATGSPLLAQRRMETS